MADRLGYRLQYSVFTCYGSNFVFRGSNVQNLSGLRDQELGHTFTLANGVEKEKISSRIFLQVWVLADPMTQ